MNLKLRDLQREEIPFLKDFPPPDWNYDLEEFLYKYFDEDYFYAVVCTIDDEIVGVGNSFLNDQAAWLANIIVLEEYRNRGLGYQITKHLIDYNYSCNCKTQILIATELGEPVYRKLGFKKVSEYRAFESDEILQPQEDKNINKIDESCLEAIYKLDQLTTNENRGHLIRKHYHNGWIYKTTNNKIQGLYLPDFGRGLVLAKDQEAGIALLQLKHTCNGKRSVTPAENQIAIKFFSEHRFVHLYKCSRMILGKHLEWNPGYMYSYGGGYFG